MSRDNIIPLSGHRTFQGGGIIYTEDEIRKAHPESAKRQTYEVTLKARFTLIADEHFDAGEETARYFADTFLSVCLRDDDAAAPRIDEEQWIESFGVVDVEAV